MSWVQKQYERFYHCWIIPLNINLKKNKVTIPLPKFKTGDEIVVLYNIDKDVPAIISHNKYRNNCWEYIVNSPIYDNNTSFLIPEHRIMFQYDYYSNIK